MLIKNQLRIEGGRTRDLQGVGGKAGRSGDEFEEEGRTEEQMELDQAVQSRKRMENKIDEMSNDIEEIRATKKQLMEKSAQLLSEEVGPNINK